MNYLNEKFKLMNDEEKTLNDYKGKTLLVVNVASECGLTPQYKDLEIIYNKYKNAGFEIIGFPANEFGAQEPGSNNEIQNFCTKNYGVTFPIAQKIVVKGDGIHPLYASLIKEFPNRLPKAGGKLRDVLIQHNLLSGAEDEIMWNFEKFLINKDGKIIGRFAPDISPVDSEFTTVLEKEIF